MRKSKDGSSSGATCPVHRPPPPDSPCVGIDGESWTHDPHRYNYLSAVDENSNKLGSITDTVKLSTRSCLDFLLSLTHQDGSPVKRVFGFAIGYDRTMMLSDLPPSEMGLLERPDMRQRLHGKGHWPVTWAPPDILGKERYSLTFLRGRFGIQKQRYDKTKTTKLFNGRVKPGAWVTTASVTVWDVFPFFQCAFVRALKDWDIADEKTRDRIAKEKSRRDAFSASRMRAIQAYCDEECHLLGQLFRRFLDAAKEAGIPKLSNFHGPGSVAGAVLRSWKVHEMKSPEPEAMLLPIRRAFFGGRFECSRMGAIPGPIYSADINSAYPAAMIDLPCLFHGTWKFAKTASLKQIQESSLALVRAKVNYSRKSRSDWGPLSFRTPDREIVFAKSCDTWTWKEEFLTAQALFPHVEAVSAWCYETPCDCKPFGEIGELYRRRLDYGADAAGKALKLAINSCYGKTAQSVGSKRFHSLIWAGMITSRTRAMLLSAFDAVKRPWQVVQFATDSVWSMRPLEGLADAGVPDQKGSPKPLGGWTPKVYREGVFVCRPGLSWPLALSAMVRKMRRDGVKKDEFRDALASPEYAPQVKPYLEEVRSRGVGRVDLLWHAPLIEKHFRKAWTRGPEGYHVPPYVVEDASRRFHGAKTSTRIAHPNNVPELADSLGGWLLNNDPLLRDESVGQWMQHPFKVSFDATPKRKGTTKSGRLLLRTCSGMSTPYHPGKRGALAVAQQESSDEALEQPSGGYDEGV